MAAKLQRLFEGLDRLIRECRLDHHPHAFLALGHWANPLLRSPVLNVPAGRPGPSRNGSMSRFNMRSAASIPFLASTSTFSAGLDRSTPAVVVITAPCLLISACAWVRRSLHPPMVVTSVKPPASVMPNSLTSCSQICFPSLPKCGGGLIEISNSLIYPEISHHP